MRHEKEYLKIVAANIVNRFGDSIDAVAFGWLVYRLTGSREWLAVILGVNLLPTVLLQPFAGAWINYLNKKAVMVLCDFGRGLLVLGIAVGYMMGVLTPVALLVITILNSSLEALRQPCGMAVTPLIVKHENFPVASALNQSTSRYLSRLPFIITTNLTLAELKEPKDIAHARIYDRILERCAPVRFSGRNYRTENAENTKKAIREIFTQEDSL